MEKNFEVSFNSPQCGWMSIGFKGAEKEFSTTTAHAPHERALPELMQILTNLLDKNSVENEYVLHWNRNPEEFDFRFVRDSENLLLEIYQYPTEERIGEEREQVYSHTGNIGEVCQAFAESFNQLYEDRDTDEFEFNWRQPFPYKEYEEFKQKFPTNKKELDD